VPTPTTAWKKLAIEVVGPLNNAPQGCRFALTLIDYYSKWPETSVCTWCYFCDCCFCFCLLCLAMKEIHLNLWLIMVHNLFQGISCRQRYQILL